jgi:integral membrane sensor domain MASE1
MEMNRHQTHNDQGAAALLIRLCRPAVTGREMLAPLAKSTRLISYVVLLWVSYYLAARLGLRFRFHTSQIGVVWVPNAVLLSALLLTPRTRWWIVLAATALAHAAAVAPLLPAWRLWWQIVFNSAFTMTTVEVLRRFAGLPLHFETRRQVLAYTAIAFAMPALFALTTPAFVLSLLHLEFAQAPTAAFLRTMLSNATALLLVAPVVFLWANFGFRSFRELRKSQLFEAIAIMISLLAVGVLALGTGPEIARLPWLLLWVFPPLLWAAVRFGPLSAATSLFFIAALSILGASRELGPFVLGTGDQILSLQLFWMILYLPVTLLAAATRERELTERALHARRNQLAHVTRAATAGELSAALAHELRQPLAAILMNAQAANTLLARRAPNLDQVREILNDIVEENNQAANIITHLQSFVRKDGLRFETLAVDKVVLDALEPGHSVIALSDEDSEEEKE